MLLRNAFNESLCWITGLLFSCFLTSATAASLPGAYFPLLEAGAAQVEERLDALPNADLKSLETDSRWRHFPYAIVAPAVLYTKNHPQNPRYRDPRMLALALRIGDLLASDHEQGLYAPRGDSDWDTGLWLEAYRLLERELGEERRARWQRTIEENVAPLVSGATERLDFPWYNSPYIGTSPNHYALWAALLHLAGKTFGKPDWEGLGKKVLRRYALVEQTPDGYWGEHSRAGPTTGYNHLTFTALATYFENSNDQDVLPALRRATEFHMNYTYPDGTSVEVINDRNRHWGVNAWGHFGFSNFPDGRRFAEFATGFFSPQGLSADTLGRLAQNALYYREGPTEPIPQDRAGYSHQMNISAGIRKTGSWTMCLSGLIDTQAVNSRFYLDRQGNVSVFHEKTGLIITGANSKRQPELATFSEKLPEHLVHMPLSSRLQMHDTQDRLSLAFNTFFSDLLVPPPTENEVRLRFIISGRGTPSEAARLTLQLRLKQGQILETAAGKRITLGAERIELPFDALGSWIRHGGWTIQVPASARLVWPVYPYNPYADAPETDLEHAVGALSVPLELQSRRGQYVRPNELEIPFTVSVP